MAPICRFKFHNLNFRRRLNSTATGPFEAIVTSPSAEPGEQRHAPGDKLQPPASVHAVAPAR
jgi:hypothetical protein